MALANVRIKINNVKNQCIMCKKEFNPLDTDVFMIQGRTYCACNPCAEKTRNYVEDYYINHLNS